MKAIIVGGGIGGLTTALMLRARGIGCELYEQADTIRELGVGINTLPHCDSRTRRPSIAAKTRRRRDPHRRALYLNRHGQEVWRDPRAASMPAMMFRNSRFIAAGCRT